MTTVSDYFRQQVYAEQSEEVVALLVTVTHQALGAERRFTSDATKRLPANADMELRYGTVSRGKEYDFLPMEITLPDDSPDGNTVINMVIQQVSQAILPILRQVRTPATVKIEVVLASRPDTVEFDFDGFKLTTADVDAGKATLGLSVDALMSEPFPADNFTPAAFGGLWMST